MKPKAFSVQVEVDHIRQSPYHFRKETSLRNLDDLQRSIGEVGLIHAVSLVEPPGEDGVYELINGHRRWLTYRRGQLPVIRANIYEYEDEELADESKRQLAVSRFLLAANRAEPLIPLERARYYDRLMEAGGFDVEGIAALHNLTPEAVAEDMTFLSLDEKVLDLVQAYPDSFSTETLKVLAEASSPSTRKAWAMTREEQVQVAEALARQTDKKLNDSTRALGKHITELVNQRRQARKVANRRLGSAGDDPVKALFKLIDNTGKAVAELGKADLSGIKEIDPRDKGAAYERLLGLAQELIDYAEGPVQKLKAKRSGASTPTGTSAASAA